MPNRNVVKQYAADTFYHAYNRGVNKQDIFLDDEDYEVFLNLFKRYLSNSPVQDSSGREYPWLKMDVQLLTFCLMPNHFHLLIFQREPKAMTELLRSVCTSYTVYYNKKYKRVGHLFQGSFKASLIDNDAYLQHISRYIHLNPKNYKTWPFSSLPYYLGKKESEWIEVEPIIELFNSIDDYETFLEDYKDYKQTLKETERALANY